MGFVFPLCAPGAVGPFEALAALARQGGRSVVWNVAGGRLAGETRPEHVDPFRRALQRAGIRVASLHSPFVRHADIAGTDPGVREGIRPSRREE